MSIHINGLPVEVFRERFRIGKAKNVTGDTDLIIGASQPLDDSIKFNVNPITGTIDYLTTEVPSVSVETFTPVLCGFDGFDVEKILKEIDDKKEKANEQNV